MPAAKIAEEMKRKPCFGKVSPQTREYLDQMEETNDGRRVDRLVEIVSSLRSIPRKK